MVAGKERWRLEHFLEACTTVMDRESDEVRTKAMREAAKFMQSRQTTTTTTTTMTGRNRVVAKADSCDPRSVTVSECTTVWAMQRLFDATFGHARARRCLEFHEMTAEELDGLSDTEFDEELRSWHRPPPKLRFSYVMVDQCHSDFRLENGRVMHLPDLTSARSGLDLDRS